MDAASGVSPTEATVTVYWRTHYDHVDGGIRVKIPGEGWNEATQDDYERVMALDGVLEVVRFQWPEGPGRAMDVHMDSEVFGYTLEDFRALAEAVARALGITNAVQEVPVDTLPPQPVVVVFAQGFDPRLN